MDNQVQKTYIDYILDMAKPMLTMSEINFPSDDENDTFLRILIENLSVQACTMTGYKELPKNFYSIIASCVVEYFNRLGNEGMNSRGELGVSTSYSYKDIEDSLRQKLKGKKNPRLFLGIWS